MRVVYAAEQRGIDSSAVMPLAPGVDGFVAHPVIF
jgi:hypothetical protein